MFLFPPNPGSILCINKRCWQLRGFLTHPAKTDIESTIQSAKIPIPYPAPLELSQSQKLGRASLPGQSSALPACSWLQSLWKQSSESPHNREQLHSTVQLSTQVPLSQCEVNRKWQTQWKGMRFEPVSTCVWISPEMEQGSEYQQVPFER